MAVTIRDVAEKAGVSISTVSRVLNATCPVHSDKSVRVERAVAELGYTPNPAARSLHSRETGGIGIILPFVSGEFFSEFLVGVDEAAQEEGYFLLISTSHHSSADLKKAMRGMYKRVDGLLIMAPLMSAAQVQGLAPEGVPFVFANTRSGNVIQDGVTFDNYGGMYAMTMHLISKGHRRIGFVKGPEKAYDALERLRGHRQALHDMGIAEDPSLIVQGDYDQKGGYESAQQLLGVTDRPTAIMASNDNAAIGVLSALRNAGIEIPSEMAVTGFDDVPSAQYANPPLSTVHVPVRELGSAAIRQLIRRLRGEVDTYQERTLPVDLRIRQTS
jgi:LacI family transcriptional regulator